VRYDFHWVAVAVAAAAIVVVVVVWREQLML